MLQPYFSLNTLTQIERRTIPASKSLVSNVYCNANQFWRLPNKIFITDQTCIMTLLRDLELLIQQPCSNELQKQNLGYSVSILGRLYVNCRCCLKKQCPTDVYINVKPFPSLSESHRGSFLLPKTSLNNVFPREVQCRRCRLPRNTSQTFMRHVVKSWLHHAILCIAFWIPETHVLWPFEYSDRHGKLLQRSQKKRDGLSDSTGGGEGWRRWCYLIGPAGFSS